MRPVAMLSRNGDNSKTGVEVICLGFLLLVSWNLLETFSHKEIKVYATFSWGI